MTDRIDQASDIDVERERLVEQELLIIEVTERITEMMEKQGITKAELARRLDQTRGHVTQLLDGSRNMTLRTVADIAFALGQRVRVAYEPTRQTEPRPRAVFPIHHWPRVLPDTKYRQWQRQDEHAPFGRDTAPAATVAEESAVPHERVGVA